MSKWENWKYKNLTLVFFGLIFAILLSRFEQFHQFLIHLGTYGYLGAFIAGILFVNIFTVSTGALTLLVLAESLSAVELGLIAGAGAVFGDLIVFKFVKNKLTLELEEIYNQIDHKHHLIKLLHTKYFNWSLPIIGALIIASPLPDELGVSLMGISKMKTYKFIAISYFLNSIGIFSIVSASIFIKP